MGYSAGMTWSEWLVDDQREQSGRPDVAVFTSDVLRAPMKISGQPIANLVASTSGTDSDWVVKLIDVYPDEVASDPRLGGYQLMISADIFRGRYRESLEPSKAIAANEPLVYRYALPTANHVFLPRASHHGAGASRVGFLSTTETRRPSCRIFSGLSRLIIKKPHNVSITRPATPASSSCRWLRLLSGGSNIEKQRGFHERSQSVRTQKIM